MAIKGSLKEASLPDVVQLLSMGRKTGILTVTEKEHFGSITFLNGKIIDSYLINRRNRIGDLLVESGDMTREQLLKALKIQKETGQKIGTILLKEQFIREDTLVKYLLQQVKETIFTMMTWKNGYFNFEPRFLDFDEEIIAINTETLLLESAKQIDELSEISIDILRDSSIIIPIEQNGKASKITKKEETVLSLLKEEKRFDAVRESSPFDKFETSGIVSSLVRKGFCRIVEGTPDISVSEKITEHFNLGIAFLRTKLYDEAEREFKYIIRLDPKNREVRFYLSVILTKTKHYKEAEVLLRKLLKETPDSPIFENNLGYILDARGKTDEAFEFFNKASRMKTSGIPLLNIGIVLFLKGDLSASKDYLEQALTADSKLVLPHFYLAIISMLSGKYKEAIHEIQYLMGKEPNMPILYYNLGLMKEKLGDLDEAEKNYKEALELVPNYIAPRMRLGEVYYRKGLYSLARSVFEMITDAGLGNAKMFLKLGNIFYKLGQKEEAVDRWKKALDLEPGNKIARSNIEMARDERKMKSVSE